MATSAKEYPKTKITYSDWKPAPWYIRMWGYNHFRRLVTRTYTAGDKTFTNKQWDYF